MTRIAATRRSMLLSVVSPRAARPSRRAACSSFGSTPASIRRDSAVSAGTAMRLDARCAPSTSTASATRCVRSASCASSHGTSGRRHRSLVECTTAPALCTRPATTVACTGVPSRTRPALNHSADGRAQRLPAASAVAIAPAPGQSQARSASAASSTPHASVAASRTTSSFSNACFAMPATAGVKSSCGTSWSAFGCAAAPART